MRRCADFCCDGRNPAEFMLPETELQRLTPDSPQRSIPARLEYRAEGLRLHTQGGWDFCLYRRRFGTAPKRRQPLPAARGHLPKWPPIRQAEQFAPSAAAMPLSLRLLARSCHNFGVGLCLQEPFGAAASASGENLLENDATGLDTGALSADRTILQPPPPVVYCSRWIEQR